MAEEEVVEVGDLGEGEVVAPGCQAMVDTVS